MYISFQIWEFFSHYFFEYIFCFFFFLYFSFSGNLIVCKLVTWWCLIGPLNFLHSFSSVFLMLFWLISNDLSLMSLIISSAWHSMTLKSSSNFLVQLLYSLAPWFLFCTFKYFLSFCWISRFVYALVSWPQWASLWQLSLILIQINHISPFWE